jgi:SAM-dependent methyltransferase
VLARYYAILEQRVPTSIKSLIPRQWRIWLGYQIKVVWGSDLMRTTPLASAMQGRGRFSRPGWGLERQSPLAASIASYALPPGETEESIFAYLAQIHLKNEGPTDERRGYLEATIKRLLITLQLVPENATAILEIGSAPYFMSLLLKRFRTEKLNTINYFSSPPGPAAEILVDAAGAEIVIDYDNVNVETEPFPYPDAHFDVVLLCEVLEHFANDPWKALLEIKRVLKPAGLLVLTTPNAVRLDNVARLISGENPNDAYSAYGPSGRHNREDTARELVALLKHCGLTVEQIFTSDIHPQLPHLRLPDSIRDFVQERRGGDLGGYVFLYARSSHAAHEKRPAWLYRSYPVHEVA